MKISKITRRSRTAFHVAALTAGLVIAATPPHSQGLVLVEDVPHIAQDAVSEVVNLGKYITQVTNQETQIANQIEQINHQIETLKRFGDPNYYINMLGLNKLIAELQSIEARANLTVYEFNRIIQSGEALRYTGQGLYQDVTTLPDRFGKQVQYDAASFTKFAMVQRMYDDYDRQQQNYRTSLQTLTTELTNAMNGLNSASTQMETEKWQAKIHGITTAMTAASDQAKLAGDRLHVQDISSYGMNTEYQFADMGSRSGSSAMVLQPNYDALCNKIAFLGTNISPSSPTDTSYNDYSVWNPWRYFKQAGSAASSAADKFNPEYWAAVIVTYLMAFVGGLAILLMQALLLLQQAIIVLSTCLLPVFIAFVAMGGSQAGIGVAFIRSVWGVLCWPIGWGIVNIGATAGIATLSTSTSGGILDAFALLMQFSLIALWIIIGTVMVPFSIQRAVTHGANAASRMVMASAGAAGAGGAAVGGKLGGMIGGIAGGGGMKGALMGGGKGAIAGGLMGGPVGALAGGAGGAAIGALPMGGSGNGKAAGSAIGSAPGKLMAMSTKAAEQIE